MAIYNNTKKYFDVFKEYVMFFLYFVHEMIILFGIK